MNRFKQTMLVALVALVATACWPHPGEGPDRRSFNPAEQTLTTANVADLGAAWRINLPQGSSPPVVDTSGVYVTSGFNVYAVERASGDSRWTRSILPMAPDLWLGTPLIDSGELLVPVSAGPVPGAVTTDDFIQPLDLATGASGDRFGGAGLDGSLRGTRLATSGVDTFRDGSGGYTISRLSVSDRGPGPGWGGYVGSFNSARVVPTLGTSDLYVAGSSFVAAFDTTIPCPYLEPPGVNDCTPTWRVNLDGATRPVVIGEDRSTLYVGTAAGTVYALDAATGATRWSAPVGSGVTGSPALANGVLYVPTASGSLVALDADGCGSSTCSPLWSAATGASISAQPAVAGGVVYTGSADGTIAAFDATGCGAVTCSALWSEDGGSSVRGLAVAFGALYVGSESELTRYDP